MTIRPQDCVVCGGTGKIAVTPDGAMPVTFTEAYQILELHDCDACGGDGIAALGEEADRSAK